MFFLLVLSVSLLPISAHAIHCRAPFGFLVADKEIGGPKKKLISDEERQAIIDSIIDKAPPGTADALLDLFDRYPDYLRDPQTMAAFERRARLMGTKIFDGWTDKSVPRESSQNELLLDVAFLLAVHGNIKDQVWDGAADTRGKLERLGVSPERFHNLVPPDLSREAAKAVLEGNFSNTQRLSDRLEVATSHSLEEFNRDLRLWKIYSEEVAMVLLSELKASQSKLRDGDDKNSKIQRWIEVLSAPMESPSLRFRLSSRDAAGLKGGERAGDCTACGSVNYWTQGAWNGAFENNELQISTKKGKFFGRLVFIAGEESGKPALYVHAVEFNPQLRQKGAMLEKEQVDLLRETFDFLAAHAKQAGFASIQITNISNSSDYGRLIERALGSDGAVKGHSFSLLGALESAKAVRKKVNSAGADKPIGIYLQGWNGSTVFGERSVGKKAAKASKVSWGPHKLSANEAERVSHIVHDFVDNLPARAKGRVSKLQDTIVALKINQVSEWKAAKEQIEQYFDYLGDRERRRVLHHLSTVDQAMEIAQSERRPQRLKELQKDADDALGEIQAYLEPIGRTVFDQVLQQMKSEAEEGVVAFQPDEKIMSTAGDWKSELSQQLQEAQVKKSLIAWSIDNTPTIFGHYLVLSRQESEATSLGTVLQTARVPLQ